MRALSSTLALGAGIVACALAGAEPGLASRPDVPGSDELFRFDPGDTVEVHGTDHFVVHYTRAGTHAVPLADADSSGVPDHVERVGAIYEEVLAHYTGALGFRAPLPDTATDPDDDPRFDVYLVDFGFAADGAFRAESCTGDACAGFLVQENDFAGYGYPSSTYANRLLASHELFHAVQAAYSASQGPTFGEGTAVWASEQFDPTLDDLELYASAYLGETDRPLDAEVTGPVDAFTYGSAIFWQFLGEQLGTDVVRALWQACSDNPGEDWSALLDDVIVAAGGDGFAALFADFASATLMTGDRADPTRGFAGAAALPELEPEGEDLPVAQERLLVFTSSYRTLAVNPGARASLRAALAGTAVNLEGLALTLAPYTQTDVGALARGVATARGLEATVEAPTDGFVFIQVVNTRQTGNGARPALCVGDDDEVTACLARLAPAAPPSGPGEDDGSNDADGDAGGGEDNDGADGNAGTGACSSTTAPMGWPLALLVPLGARRRGRLAAARGRTAVSSILGPSWT